MAAQSIPSNSGSKASRWTQPISISALLMLVPFLVMPVQAQAQTSISGQSCTNTTGYDANYDYFKTKIVVDDAALFSVQYKNNYKVVTNTYSLVNQSFVLTQCGTPVPDASLFPNNTVFTYVPASNVASISTTGIAYIEMLGARSTIKAIDTESLVTSPCGQYGLEHGEIQGLEDTNMTLRAQQLSSIDLIFNNYDSDPASANRTVITSEVSDPGPLNRAEWLEFYSTFFNLEEAAQNLTASINNNYNCFKNAVASKATKPVIAWATYTAPSTYNNNTPSWAFSNAPYKMILSADAGATFYNGTTNMTFTTAAAFAAEALNVDVLIDETYTGADINAFYTNYNLTASSPHKFIQNKAVFREDGLVNKNDGRDWFAGAVVMDDALLQDLIRAVHPDALPDNVPYNWLRNIAKNEPEQILSSANCTTPDSNAATPDRAIQCSTMKVGTSSASSKTVAGTLTAVLGFLAIALAF
ncbi:hypothetical protein BGZ80_006637 [Entomortierella chlamydospora]|uniref:Periplasmic binding protein n=1 Tax=Entomortierella chlamydospora TaxID=101097 RepID=A0A9P6MH20_9FUNG|nr:hypothetical protein BGZ80_006637 [Entomortierella chlamydospora]KAG0004967.1 hypothetical protein BGZ79_007399 [Entomortierella chlamydospora]